LRGPDHGRAIAHALGGADALVADHPLYRALGRTAAERQVEYRALFRGRLDETFVAALRHATSGWALGDEPFKREIAAALDRRLGCRRTSLTIGLYLGLLSEPPAPVRSRLTYPATGHPSRVGVRIMDACPCGSGRSFDDCCGPIIGGAAAATAEAQMRSRYSAFVRGNFDHLEGSLAPEARAKFNRSATEARAGGITWLGLDIRAATGGGAEDDTGTVEFAARFKEPGQEEELIHHELARFRREEGRWVYVEGAMNPKAKPREVTKVGRNQLCPCGSGLKFKRCCGN
jgi:SEC-C motif domain protein